MRNPTKTQTHNPTKQTEPYCLQIHTFQEIVTSKSMVYSLKKIQYLLLAICSQIFSILCYSKLLSS